GVMGGLRGTFFFNVGAAGLNNQQMTFLTSKSQDIAPLIGYEIGLVNGVPQINPGFGPTQTVAGFRLVDGRASYGFGLESFILGFPMHFDFSWKTLFNQQWEDIVFASTGGHGPFRRMKFSFWIGYDF